MRLTAPRTLAGALAAAILLTGCGATDAPTIADIGLAEVGTYEVAQVVADATTADPIPASTLRRVLTEQLVVHAILTTEVLRGTVDDAMQLQASADALTANTLALRDAVGLAYGEVGGVAFSNLWVEHVRSFATYATALDVGDVQLAETARRELAHYEEDFASFCAIATDGRLPNDAVEALLTEHVDALTGQADAWAAGDHAAAIAQSSAAVANMAVIADALAGAIADQHPDRFPGPLDAPAGADTAGPEETPGLTDAPADDPFDPVAAAQAADQVWLRAQARRMATGSPAHVAMTAAITDGSADAGAAEGAVATLIDQQADAWAQDDPSSAYELTNTALGLAIAS